MPKAHSQFNQDVYIFENFFKNQSNPGLFVDIGAHDGITFSNTYYFEKYHNWTGYCFEPIPRLYHQLKENRPLSICYDVAISDFNGFETFKIVEGYAEMLSGLLSNYNTNHLQRIQNEINQFGGQAADCQVVVSQLKNILPPGINIDYFSIDTEGGEAKCLNDILQYYKPKIISTEINYSEEINNVNNLMTNYGYSHNTVLGVDHIYVLNQS